MPEVVRKLGVTEQTHDRWKREYGELRTDQAKRLSDLFARKGVPDHIRSANGSEFTAKRVREWLERAGVKTLSIEPGSPWENGYIESFNEKLRDELLARKVSDRLLEAKVLIERWRKACNTVRPRSSLGYRPPAQESPRRVFAAEPHAAADERCAASMYRMGDRLAQAPNQVEHGLPPGQPDLSHVEPPDAKDSRASS